MQKKTEENNGEGAEIACSLCSTASMGSGDSKCEGAAMGVHRGGGEIALRGC